MPIASRPTPQPAAASRLSEARRVAGGGALLLALALGGCAAPRLTPQLAAEMGYEVLGARMQYDDKFTMAWIPAAAIDPASSPLTLELARLIAPAARQPVHVAVAGDDSAFAAGVLRAACEGLGSPLPHLRLVFVGQPAHQALARAAVEALGGEFYFQAMP